MKDIEKKIEEFFALIRDFASSLKKMEDDINLKYIENDKKMMIIREKEGKNTVEVLKIEEEKKLVEKEKEATRVKQKLLEAKEKRLNEKMAQINQLMQE